MKTVLGIVSICLLIHLAAAPPPRRIETDEKKNQEQKDELEDFGLEYSRYLKEVIDLLESDPEFKKKLEDAQETDIRSGQIAKELEFVDHKVRTKLDEVKRQEIERLRHLAQKQYELNNGIDTEHVKVSSEHLDHENLHTFEMEDLKKLIAKVSQDLNEADEKRRQEFKEYEMQKEFEKQQKLKHLEGSEREAFEKQLKENETKHKQHEPLHHPGSKQQLEEVWEKQDHMENQDFDPKVFFQLHDLDGNGFWDHNEVKTLFLKELDKMYQAGAPEDDMKERAEEMERMREHVFSEADKNKDGLISYEEFIDKTKQPDFEKDPGWESLDQKPVYTQEEYHEFERRRQEEIQRMIQQGLISPQPAFHPGQGYHNQPQYVQYHGYPAGHGYPPHAQPPYRYAQDFPNPSPPHGFPNQHPGSHQNQFQQTLPHSGVVNQQHQERQQQAPSHPNQLQQSYQQSQGVPNPPEGHQSLTAQGYQQQAQQPPSPGYQNQPAQGYQQQAQQPSNQGYQNQPAQGYQQQAQQPSNQGYQNQPAQGYQQQPQQPPSQGHQNYPSQNFQQSSQGLSNQAPHGYKQPSHANQGSPSNSNLLPNQPAEVYQNNFASAGQPTHDPNDIRPDSKYSKTEGGNSHPNVIDTQQKKSEQNNEHQSKFPNQ